MDGVKGRSDAGRLRTHGRLTYNLSVTVGVLAMTVGAWLEHGIAAGAATFGALVLVMSVYAVERLNRD